MWRRDFLKSAAGGTAARLAWPAAEGSAKETARAGPRFTPCVNQATTMNADFRASMEAYHQAGFRAVELWLDSVEPFLAKESVAVARRVMGDRGLEPVSSCCEADLFFPRVQDRDKKLDGFRRKLHLSAELGAHRFVMFSAISEEVSPADYSAAVPCLRAVGDLGKESGIVVGIEFIKGAKFLGCLETTADLLRKVAHPSLGILLDTFHFYSGISKVDDIRKLKPGEISFVHINDVPAMPRELLEDRHRVFLGEGVMPLEKILRALSVVYSGSLSFEAFQYAAEDPLAVARKSYEEFSRLLAKLEKT